ncbi:MAG: hypothetical protein FWG08_05070 [Propionibacteriaceae bacterium]|nr:hypothetical protein [Propionibacteriaceae bacterium]
MSNSTTQYSSDPIEQLLLEQSVRWFGGVDDPFIPPSTLIAGSRVGFSEKICRAIFWNIQSQCYLVQLLEDYRSITHRAIPHGLERTVEKEKASGGPQWNTCLLGKLMVEGFYSSPGYDEAIASLPADFRDKFNWAKWVTYAPDPVMAEPMFAYAASSDIEPDLRFDPKEWEEIRLVSGLQIGWRLVGESVAVGVFSETREGFVNLEFTWADGHTESGRIRLIRGDSAEDAELIPAHGGENPKSVALLRS